jgi:hypothetical protein
MQVIRLVMVGFVFQINNAWSWDSDYESCVRNHIQKAETAQAAIVIKNTCKEKFSKKLGTNKQNKANSCTPKSPDDYCSFLIKEGKAVRSAE